MEVVYSPFDDSHPDYMKPNDMNFAGAVGSALIIDDVEMVCGNEN